MNDIKKPYPTGSPKFSIPQKIADIALKYGRNVSRGIKEMERLLNAR
jgi:hypothetical protein